MQDVVGPFRKLFCYIFQTAALDSIYTVLLQQAFGNPILGIKIHLFRKASSVQKLHPQYIPIFFGGGGVLGFDSGNKRRGDFPVGIDYVNNDFFVIAIEDLAKSEIDRKSVV